MKTGQVGVRAVRFERSYEDRVEGKRKSGFRLSFERLLLHFSDGAAVFLGKDRIKMFGLGFVRHLGVLLIRVMHEGALSGGSEEPVLTVELSKYTILILFQYESRIYRFTSSVFHVYAMFFT